MRKIIVEGWEAYTNSDLCEGRGSDVHIAYFKNEKDARKAATGKGPMGGNAYVRLICKDTVVFDSYEEYTIQKALSKLTLEEQKLLGLVELIGEG